jgi:eukaryotic-like serine/threonine-protein kinase
MATALKVLRELTNESAILRALEGNIDERFTPAVLDSGGKSVMTLDLEGVHNVNSFGVREWIRGLTALRSRLSKLFFVRASPRVTDQLNMVMGFDGGGTLLSFRANYDCKKCGESSIASFDTQLDRQAFTSLQAPLRQCRVCGREAQLDDDPSVLFEYARANNPAPPPPEMMGLLRHPESWLDELPGVRLMVRPTVAEDVTVYRMAGIIDNTLSIRRLVDGTSGKTCVQLARVAHLEPTAIGHWQAMVGSLQEKGPLSLASVPPVILRRAIEAPDLLAGLQVDSLCVPLRCDTCRTTTWKTIEVSGITKPPRAACRICDKNLAHVASQEDRQSFQRVVENRSAESPARLAPVRSERRPSSSSESSGPVRTQHAFEDKYEVLTKIGQGGMADVFLARQLGAMGFKRLVVIKKVNNQLNTDDRMVRLFLDEARLAGLLEHPNIVRVHDLGRTDETFYMVMDFVHGRNLAEIMKDAKARKMTMPPKVAAYIAAEVSSGLARAHAPDSNGQGLVHRDVTPNNVMVSYHGAVKLTDFGLAGYRHFEKDPLRQNHIIGNIPFVAPEVYQGKKVHAQTDIWGVGLTLLVCLTGQNPFAKDTMQETARSILKDRVRWPWRQVPWRLFRIVKRCLHKDAMARYENAEKLQSDLRAWAGEGAAKRLNDWLHQLYALDLEREQRLVSQRKAASLSEAFLAGSPSEVTDLLAALRNAERAESPQPQASVRESATRRVAPSEVE